MGKYPGRNVLHQTVLLENIALGNQGRGEIGNG
jgi:hypothetical protein